MILLSSMLAFNGCGKNQEKNVDQKDRFCQQYFNTDINQLEDDFFSFNYLKHFASFMKEEQIESFLKIDKTADDKTFIGDLNELMKGDTNEGRGIYNAFNTRLFFENIGPYYSYREEYYTVINTLRTIVANDEAFYQSLFSQDIELFIDCIVENTGIRDRALVSELVMKMDIYSDLLSSEEYQDEVIKKEYIARINEIVSLLFEAKCRKDDEIKRSLFAKVMRESNCMRELNYTLYQELIGNEFVFEHIGITMENSYEMKFSNEYLYNTKCTIEQMESIRVKELIKEALTRENKNSEEAFFLMLHLMDFSTFSEMEFLDASCIKEEMFKELKSYFASESEFDFFYLCLANRTRSVEDTYFQILEGVILRDGITYEDYIRYLSLSNFLEEHVRTHYDWATYELVMPYDEFLSISKEEARKQVYTTYSSSLFNYYTYPFLLENIEDALSQNDLGYEKIYNQEYKISCDFEGFSIQNNSISVLSSLVEPREGKYQGMSIIYYEIPENYEEGSAVEYYKNIEDKWTVCPVEGFKDTFYDERRGEVVTGFIISMNETLTEENKKTIRFMEYYKYYEEKKESKVLKLEGANESE